MTPPPDSRSSAPEPTRDDLARAADALERIEEHLAAIRALLEAAATPVERGGIVLNVYDHGRAP